MTNMSKWGIAMARDYDHLQEWVKECARQEFSEYVIEWPMNVQEKLEQIGDHCSDRLGFFGFEPIRSRRSQNTLVCLKPIFKCVRFDGETNSRRPKPVLPLCSGLIHTERDLDRIGWMYGDCGMAIEPLSILHERGVIVTESETSNEDVGEESEEEKEMSEDDSNEGGSNAEASEEEPNPRRYCSLPTISCGDDEGDCRQGKAETLLQHSTSVTQRIPLTSTSPTGPITTHGVFMQQGATIAEIVTGIRHTFFNDESIVAIPEEHGALSFISKKLGCRGPEVRFEPPYNSTQPWRLLCTVLQPNSITNMQRSIHMYPILADNAYRTISHFFRRRVRLSLPADWDKHVIQTKTVLQDCEWEPGSCAFLKDWAQDVDHGIGGGGGGGILAISAGAASGKSHAAMQFWKHKLISTDRVETLFAVDIAVRRSLVDDKARRWKTVLPEQHAHVITYSDLARDPWPPNHIGARVVISTRESLLRIPRPLVPQFLFIDEFNTVFAEFTGQTMQQTATDTLAAFQDYVANVPYIMMAEAYMTHDDVKTLQLLQEMRKHVDPKTNPLRWLHVERICPCRHFIFTCDFVELLDDLVRDVWDSINEFHNSSNGNHQMKPVIVATQTRTMAMHLISKMREHGIPAEYMLCYHRETRYDICEESQAQCIYDVLQNGKCALFVHTSILGPGVDITIPVRSVYGLLTGFSDITPVAFLQMLYRARNPSRRNILVCVDATSLRGHEQKWSFSSTAKDEVTLRYTHPTWVRHRVIQSAVYTPMFQQFLFMQGLVTHPTTEADWHHIYQAKLPVTLELMIHLVTSRRVAQEQNIRSYGQMLLSLIATSGDTFAVQWLAPERLWRETAGSVERVEKLKQMCQHSRLTRKRTFSESTIIVHDTLSVPLVAPSSNEDDNIYGIEDGIGDAESGAYQSTCTREFAELGLQTLEKVHDGSASEEDHARERTIRYMVVTGARTWNPLVHCKISDYNLGRIERLRNAMLGMYIPYSGRCIAEHVQGFMDVQQYDGIQGSGCASTGILERNVLDRLRFDHWLLASLWQVCKVQINVSADSGAVIKMPFTNLHDLAQSFQNHWFFVHNQRQLDREIGYPMRFPIRSWTPVTVLVLFNAIKHHFGLTYRILYSQAQVDHFERNPQNTHLSSNEDDSDEQENGKADDKHRWVSFQTRHTAHLLQLVVRYAQRYGLCVMGTISV